MAKRRRGARTRPPTLAATRPFEELVDVALAAIPEPFASALDEVAIVIDDEPTRRPAARERARAGRDAVRPVRGRAADRVGRRLGAVPNRIILFRLPLEADFADPDDLADEVWVTVVHELAHHLGIDDDRLEELGSRLTPVSGRAAPGRPRGRSRRATNPSSIGMVNQRKRRTPARRASGSRSPPRPDVVETDGGVRQPDEHHDLRRDRDARAR